MNKEIDLRALINNNLKCEAHDVNPTSFSSNETINLIERPFEKEKKWNKKEKTNYIESIFLNCSLQPIIRFKNNNYTIIVDGYNRYSTIKSFLNNEFELDEKGLNQLKFLANDRYSDLEEYEKESFNKNACIKILDYSCESRTNDKKILDADEELEVLKYLYTLYNTGLKLEIEEIQKAQFSDDYITKKIKEKLTQDSEFLEMLESLKLYNGRRKRNKIENILLNCRTLIASTYSNIYNFSNTFDLQTRIEENYLPNINNYNKDKIYEDFIININQIYNNLVNTERWQAYKILHCKPFIEATYWLISVIRKDNLADAFSFDFMKYLEYFGQKEATEKNFDVYYAHYTKNILKKYQIVAQYYENEYIVKMDKYFKTDQQKNNSFEIINSIEELHKKNFNFTLEKIQISDLIKQIQTSSYNLRPYYQRFEIMNTTLSSKIIESILLGIRIPYILTCDKYINGHLVTEVVDGQQRLLSILGLLGEPFMNENCELEYSNKNGYYLRNLRILSEFNGCSVNKQHKSKLLSKDYINKIKESYLYFYRTKDTGNNNFNTIDYFVRLNKKASLIKENSYRMFCLTADRKIMDFVKVSTAEFLGNLLPKENSIGKPYLITLRLSCLFYNKQFNELNYSNYNNKKVSFWLNDFNKFKDENMYSNFEEIDKLRNKYYNSINETIIFYNKIKSFLDKTNKTINDMVAINSSSHIPLSYYYYLFYLLGNISISDLIDNNVKIYSIIESFFSKLKNKNIVNNDIISQLDFFKQQILVYDSNILFRQKLKSTIKNIS